jgi:hypothetical protein
MLMFVICFLAGANPEIWLPDAEFDKKYCRDRLGRVQTMRTQLNMLYEAMARNPNLANDEAVIAATQRTFERMQREIKELDEERAEHKLRLIFPPPKDRKDRTRDSGRKRGLL